MKSKLSLKSTEQVAATVEQVNEAAAAKKAAKAKGKAPKAAKAPAKVQPAKADPAVAKAARAAKKDAEKQARAMAKSLAHSEMAELVDFTAPCSCGCGGTIAKVVRFLPGHDAKMLSALIAKALSLNTKPAKVA